MQQYEDSLKYYRDLQNSLDTARAEGMAEGQAKGLEEGMRLKAAEVAHRL